MERQTHPGPEARKQAMERRDFKVFMIAWTIACFSGGVAVGIWTMKMIGP